MKTTRPLWFRTLAVVTLLPLVEWLRWLSLPHDETSQLAKVLMFVPLLVIADVALAWVSYKDRPHIANLLLVMAWLANACVIAVLWLHL